MSWEAGRKAVLIPFQCLHDLGMPWLIIAFIYCGLSLFILKHLHVVHQCLLKIRHT